MNAPSEFFDPYAIPLVGRDSTMASAGEALDGAPGCLVIVGEPKAGVTRIAVEVMNMAEQRGARLIWAESGVGDPVERIEAGLGAAGLPATLNAAAASEAFAAYVGSCDTEAQGRLARTLRGTAGLVICEAETSVAAPSLRVGALDRDAAGKLVDSIDPSMDVAVREHVLATADGLPGCILSLARVADVGRLPEELAILVRSRIGDLDTPGRAALYWASILAVFDPTALAAVADEPAEVVVATLGELRRRGLVTADPRLASGMEFVHELTRWAVARRLTDSVAPNTAIIDVERARVLLGERLRLIELAKEGAHPTFVLLQTELGLDEWRPELGVAVRPQLLAAQAWAYGADFHSAQALEALDQAHRLAKEAGDRELADRLSLQASGVRSRLWERQSALDDITERHTEPAPAAQPSASELELQANAALAAMRAFRHTEAIRIGEAVLAHPGASMSPETVLNAELAVRQSAAFIEPTRSNIDRLSPLREEALRLRASTVAVTAANSQVTLLGDLHAEYGLATEVSDSTVRALRQADVTRGPSFVELVLGLVLLETGDVRRAHRALETYEREPLGDGNIDFPAFVRLWLARIRGERDELDKHRCRLAPWVNEGAPDLYVALALNLALMAIPEQGLMREDEQDLVSRALVLCEDEAGVAPWKLFLFAGAVEADLAPGRSWWRDRLESLATCRGAGVLAQCRYVDAFFVEDPREATAAFRDAAAGFAELGIHWWAARARMMGGILGAEDCAAEDLRAARTAFAAIGATGWRERVEAELRRRGHRWSAAPSTSEDRGPLSGRELEVVRELAAGLTNAQIAARLVLSENTVARHLTRIYRKLGVSSRSEAVVAATDALGVDA